MITIQVTDAGFQQRINLMAATVKNPRAVMMATGREGVRLLKRHFIARDKTPNKLGGKREHFWRQVSHSVFVSSAENAAVVVSIGDPRFAQKYMGGAIKPKFKKALTIPMTPEAYGRTTDVFERETGLQLFLIKGWGSGILATKINPQSLSFTVQYILRKSVRQDPDPAALPDMVKFTNGLRDAFEAAFARQIALNGPN
jgi:hypothetical protein